MARIKVVIKAQATVEIEEEFYEGYSDGDLIEAADNSRLGWLVTDATIVKVIDS